MGFLLDVRRGAKAVAHEAETRTQLAMKHAEAANLSRSHDEVLAEAGREALAAGRSVPAGGAIAVSVRLRALFDEATRFEAEQDRVRGDIERLRRQSLFAKKESEPHGAPRA